MAVHVEPASVRVLSRNGNDWTARVPAIVDAARAIGGTMILDGEAVLLDDNGRSDFSALQNSFGGKTLRRASASVIVYAFDLLYLDGNDLTRMGLHERRAMREQARAAITAWKEDYNRNRPHSSLGNIIPSEFAIKMVMEKQAA